MSRCNPSVFIILSPEYVLISVLIFVTFIYRKKKRKKRQPREYTMSQYPEPPPPDRVEARYREERQLARLREVKEKQDLILQRRKYVQCVQILRGFWRFKPKVTVKNWGGVFLAMNCGDHPKECLYSRGSTVFEPRHTDNGFLYNRPIFCQ